MDGIPEEILFCVARHGDIDMLRWLERTCVEMFYECRGCGFGPLTLKGRDNAYDRVLRDAAAAGHAEMVTYCLDSEDTWMEYTETIMQAAASEGRSNVIVMLEERGHPCTASLREQAALAAADKSVVQNLTPLMDKFEQAPCPCGWDGMAYS